MELIEGFETADDVAASGNDHTGERANTPVKYARIQIGACLEEGERESALDHQKKKQNYGQSQDAWGLQLPMGQHLHFCQLLLRP